MSIVMKKQDINAVLEQAADLRANLCTAIDRSLLAHFNRFSLSSAAPELRDAGHGDGAEAYSYLPISSSIASLAEARSLASIRDALIVLEEQLECLQSLPDHHREERKATLAELEESRQILLRRLKQHRGRELAVIQDALSFVGESNEDDLPVAHIYSMPARLVDTDLRQKLMGGVEFSIEDVRTYMKKLREKPHTVGKAHDGSSTRPNGLLSDLKCRLLTFLNRRIVKASAKCLFAVAGTAAVLTLSNSMYRSSNTQRRKEASATVRLKGAGCPENWKTVQSGVQRCVLTEPFEDG